MIYPAWISLGLVWGTALSVTVGAASPPVSFSRDIRPILSENCYLCHGPDPGTRKAKLRLDIESGANAKAIVPGKPDESELVRRISTSDADDHMPPAKSGKHLTPSQVESLRRWVAEGAKWESHWAYEPVRAVAPPPVEDSQASVRNPIDRFIGARLEKEGLKPSPEADRRTLIHRLSFDLTGLPPKPEDVEAFLKDQAADAYEKIAVRLLASPNYGERIAVWWLDLVRYADSVGYHGDQFVSVWPYRDYVINAFNRNLPFDQFTREQLAGDLLPKATKLQQVASGYNRLGMMSAEGGVQDKEYRAKYAAERVRNVAGTWLGSTMGCAECHDHKFDPFTTKDFYRMAAFFADVKEKGFYDLGFSSGNWGPSLRLATDDQQKELGEIEARIAEAKEAVEAVKDESLAAARDRWERDVLAYETWGRLGWQLVRPDFATSANGTHLEIQGDKSVFASGPNPDHEVFIVRLPAAPDRITALRLEVLKDEKLPGNDLARSGQTFVLSEVEIDAETDGQPSALVKVARVVADFEAEGFPALALMDGRSDTGWAQGGGPPSEREAVFHFAEPLQGGTNVSLTVRLRHESRFTRHTVGHFRLSLTSLELPPGAKNGVPEDVLKAIKVPPEKRDANQQKLIARHYRRVTPELVKPLRELARLEAERSLMLGRVPTTLVAEAGPPRTMRVLPRGNWMDDTGEVVQPGVPRFLKQIDSGTNRANRLDLANWVVSRDNPLTARVLANRLWKMFFGVGLSKSTEDFGTQGEGPVHPELLDWLASDLVEHGWDLKRTVRLMVTSTAYRQISRSHRQLDERDPYNRLYARQARVRLDAEFIRDNALAVSGLLVDHVGGPSVMPWQPPGYWAPLNFPRREYEPDRGEATWRRGLYTHWQRTYLHPAMLAFDAPTREECTVNRTTSNTPLQALVLLNDPEFVEAARVFAAKIARQPGDFAQRLQYAFDQALGRPPQPPETKTLEDLYGKQRAFFEKDEAAARQLVSVGGAPQAPDMPVIDLAAWTSVSRALLNLHETITRN
jgi:hypothetical protein